MIVSPHPVPTHHVVVGADDRHEGTRAVLVVCGLVEVSQGVPCRPVVEVRAITDQGRLFP